MIRHSILFTIATGVTDDDRARLLEDMAALPDHFPQMRRFAIGPNVSKRDQTFSHMMTIDFDSRSDLEGYLDSARHEDFVRERFKPLVSTRAIATIEQE